jgi:uncharacterized membrane protein
MSSQIFLSSLLLILFLLSSSFYTKLDELTLVFLRENKYSSNENEQEIFTINAEVLNVKILRIVSKLCIGIGDTKFEQLMTLFSIDNGFYLGKTKRL